jgi:hypothetical protein
VRSVYIGGFWGQLVSSVIWLVSAMLGTWAPLVVDTSDGYGAWKPMGEESNQFAVTFQRFLFAAANTPTGPTGYGSFFPGQNVGVNNVEAVATLHTGEGGDTLTGPFTTQFVTLSGQVAFAESGTFTATRFKTKPLS